MAYNQDFKSKEQHSSSEELKEELANEEANRILAAEEIEANELETERQLLSARQKLETVAREGESYDHPSYLKYFILFSLAGIIDFLDVVLDLTGVLAILASAISIALTIVLILILYFTNMRMKRAEDYVESIESVVADIEKDIIYATRLALRSARIMRRVPGLKKIARQIPRALVKVRRFARGNPIFKVLIGGVLNAVPYLAIVNLMIVWVYLAYRDERRVYEHAREAAKDISGQELATETV